MVVVIYTSLIACHQDDNTISHSVTMGLLNDISSADLNDDDRSYQEQSIKEAIGTAYAGELHLNARTYFINSLMPLC